MEPDDTLAFMEASDSSEAHAIQECIQDAMQDVPKREQKQAARNMLIEFRDWAVTALKRIDNNGA